MKLADHLSNTVDASSEYLFLPTEHGLGIDPAALNFERSAMRALAAEALIRMGLSSVLRPGGEHADDIVPKPHHKVAGRDAAVAEQFHHPDVATNGFSGIFLIGLEGDNLDVVPETQVVDNAAMVEHIADFVKGGPLEERLADIWVVRPFFDADHRDEWMNLPRHSLERLGRQFDDLLTPEQRDHVSRERTRVTDTSKFIGEVFISRLVTNSVVDNSPLLTCGVAQRELRLALDDPQDGETVPALKALHDEITRYLMNPAAPYKSQKVTTGSALFVPVGQLHKATPYLPHHRRSVVGVRCYPQAGEAAPASWQRASGLEF